MKRTNRLMARVIVGWLAASGCASVEPGPDYQRTGDRIRETVGMYETYDPDHEFEFDRRIDEMAAEGLTLDEAVQIALLNNPSLRAAYARIGIARADVVQSRLLSNPVIGLSFQFPEGGGRSNFQASIAQSLVELWQIPLRTRSAERDLDEAVLRLAHEAARVAIDAKSAYWRAVGAEASATIAVENRELASRLVDVALARRKAGAVGELDVNLARGTLLASDLDVMQTRLDSAASRRRLAVVLGLTIHVESLALQSPWPDDPVPDDVEQVVATAMASRLDLRAAGAEVESAAARLSLEFARVFPEVSAGLLLERSERRAQKGRKLFADTLKSSVASGGFTAPDIPSRGERNLATRAEIDAILGPSLSLELPLFDQNQAGIARARFEYQQAAAMREAIRRSIIQEARQATDAASTARSIVAFYDTTFLPQAETNLELSRTTYEAGRTSLVTVLEAQQALLTARRVAVKAREEAATTFAELERVAARPLRGGPTPNASADDSSLEHPSEMKKEPEHES